MGLAQMALALDQTRYDIYKTTLTTLVGTIIRCGWRGREVERHGACSDGAGPGPDQLQYKTKLVGTIAQSVVGVGG